MLVNVCMWRAIPKEIRLKILMVVANMQKEKDRLKTVN